MIEKEVQDVWVVTTDLKNDVTPGKIRNSVVKNLEDGKSYTYFVPARKNPNFSDAGKNEEGYKRCKIYKKHVAQIRFIRLPDDTLFLFREVVIYNPIIDPNMSGDKVGATGFTYFDTEPGSRDGLMRIPDGYLYFLLGQLDRYKSDIGLRTELERLIEEVRGRLCDEDLRYLVNQFGKRSIENKTAHRRFVESVGERDADLAARLDRSLQPYVEEPS